jgi:hypothetical protein
MTRDNSVGCTSDSADAFALSHARVPPIAAFVADDDATATASASACFRVTRRDAAFLLEKGVAIDQK